MLAVAIVGGLTACRAATRARPTTASAPRASRAPIVAVDDETLVTDVRTRLSRESVHGGVNVDVHRGVVYLRGAVRSRRQKDRATQVARQAPSVADVVNTLKVATP